MNKIETLKRGYVWLDVWMDDDSRVFLEPYIVKRDATGRSSKYSIEEALVMRELQNIAFKKYLLDL